MTSSMPLRRLVLRAVPHAASLACCGVLHAGVQPGPGGVSVQGGPAAIDLDGDGSADLELGNTLAAGWCQALGPNNIYFLPSGPMLPAGVSFGPDAPAESFFSSFGLWHIVCPLGNCQLVCDACGDYHVGLVFQAADGMHAGWLRLAVEQIAQTTASLTLVESAWETVPGHSITTGGGLDCDGNGVADAIEIAASPSLDCNGNGTLDACEAPGLPAGGHALGFHGGSDRVLVASGGAAVPQDEVTIELWIRPEATQESVAFAVATGNDANRCLAHIPWADGIVYFDFGDFLGNGRLAYVPPVPIVGSWQHFAFVASASQNRMSIYRNGVLEATKPGMTPFGAGGSFDLLLGGIVGYGSTSAIDEFHLWTGVRSQAQIAADMVGVDPGAVGLALSFRFEEGAGGLTFDAASGLTGQLLGDVAWIEAFHCDGRPEDLNHDGSVDAADLAILLGAWGPIPPGMGSIADLDANNVVDAADLALLLGAFGG